MKKVAFFVEGATELFFLKELLKAIFSEKEIVVECKKMKGGKNVAIQTTTIEAGEPAEETKYFFLIYNCTGETNVKSYMRAQRRSLITAGYEKIIGIRDVYPNFTRIEIPQLERSLLYGLPQKDLPGSFILVIMEIEAWFLAEFTHFEKIEPSITIDRIINGLGFDPSQINTEDRNEPAVDLDNIYKLGGETYEKTDESISRTIEALSFEDMYFNLPERIPKFKNLIDLLEEVII